jgi:hypothetical protein
MQVFYPPDIAGFEPPFVQGLAVERNPLIHIGHLLAQTLVLQFG